MRKFTFIIFIAVGCFARQASESRPSAQAVLDQIKTKGAKGAVRLYTSGKGDEWHFILQQIAAGDPKWLSVASELSSATDASYTEDLKFSVATALTKNPVAVLRLKSFRLEDVCDVPYLEPSDKVVRDYQAKAGAALETVKEADLQAKKQKCRTILMAP